MCEQHFVSISLKLYLSILKKNSMNSLPKCTCLNIELKNTRLKNCKRTNKNDRLDYDMELTGYQILCQWSFAYFILGRHMYAVLFENKERVPDSAFSASVSTKGHSPSHARISSGSSWCAPVSDGKYYLQVDFGRLYFLYDIVTYGDSTSPKWVTRYNFNYTTDLRNWRTITKVRTLQRKREFFMFLYHAVI